MNKKNAREALDIYKRFLVRMERTAEFLKVCEVSTTGPDSCGVFPYLISVFGV